MIEGKTDSEVFTMMNNEAQKGVSMPCLMTGGLHSYNILHNKKYSRLGDLKKILDN